MSNLIFPVEYKSAIYGLLFIIKYGYDQQQTVLIRRFFPELLNYWICARSKDNFCCNKGFKVRERSLLYNCTYIITITLPLKPIFIYNHLIKINERRKSIKRKISVFQRSFNQQLGKSDYQQQPLSPKAICRQL